MTVAELEEHLRGLDPTLIVSLDVDGLPKPVEAYEILWFKLRAGADRYRTMVLIPGKWPNERNPQP